MKRFHTLSPGHEKYLIIAAMPTPNGRLHLGHMSGPYLKVDIIARAQRRNGSDVCVISGCDGLESYVALKAWQTQKTTEEVCHYYANLSLKDLSTLGVHYDGYVNPMDPVIKQGFEDFAIREVQKLVDGGFTEVRPEQYLYSPTTNRYIVGCWLLGKCPNCHADAGSYQCEDCGTQFRPMDMLEPHSRAKETDLEVIDDLGLYLKISKEKAFWDHVNTMGIDDTFQNIVRDYFKLQGHYIRLTNPDDFGIPWQLEGSNIPQVIYTATYMNAFMVYMGELYKKLKGTDKNPFDLDSDVTTMVSFGIDCSIPYVLGMSWAIESDFFKPVDYLLPNYFCNLEDSKFSTSRGHAIWGEDIVAKTPLTGDAVRYYLVLINPEHSTTSFRVDHFIDTVNQRLAHDLQPKLECAWELVETNSNDLPQDFPIESLEKLIISQVEHLRPPAFEMAAGLESIHEWLRMYEGLVKDSPTSYWWLKGLSILAFPIMPEVATFIWKQLGHASEPIEASFFETPVMGHLTPIPVFFREISFEDIKEVLPKTLLTETN